MAVSMMICLGVMVLGGLAVWGMHLAGEEVSSTAAVLGVSIAQAYVCGIVNRVNKLVSIIFTEQREQQRTITKVSPVGADCFTECH